jgi:hypothetical protein
MDNGALVRVCAGLCHSTGVERLETRSQELAWILLYRAAR